VGKTTSLHIEKLPDGVYLATNRDLPVLVVPGGTITEVLEFARDVARQLTHRSAAPAAVL